MDALDFHEDAVLCHINGISPNNVHDVYIRADGYYQLEYSLFVSYYFLGEIADLIVARHVLVELAPFARDKSL